MLNEDSYEVLSLPHSNLVELTMRYNDLSFDDQRTYYFSSDELISIASSKKKGFTLQCIAKYED